MAADKGKLQPDHTVATAVMISVPGFGERSWGSVTQRELQSLGEVRRLASRWAKIFLVEWEEQDAPRC